MPVIGSKIGMMNKGTGRDGTVMFRSVLANVPLAVDVQCKCYFTKISDSFVLQPASRTTIHCNLLMETVPIKGEVISSANRSTLPGCSLLCGGVTIGSTDTDGKVSVECTPKSAVGHGCRSRTSTA